MRDSGSGPAAARLELLAAYNGDVITMDLARPRASALLSLGGRIVACGDDGEVRAAYESLRGLRGISVAESINLRGRAVLPGLIDSHLHLLWYGFFLQVVDLNGARSIGDLQGRLAERLAKTPSGAWITGAGWQQDLFAERRMPSRSDIDAVVPDNPVFLQRVCYHAAVANSVALRIAGITSETPDPPGGAIDRDPVTGEPTGVLRETAVELIGRHMPAPGEQDMLAALRAACQRASAAGLTSVHTNDGPGQALRAYLALRDAGALTVRAYFDTTLEPDDATALTLPPGLGDEWVRVGAVKLFADGSLGARTALLREPYSDEPGARGLPIYSQERLDDLVWRAHAAGRQLAVHAIGDAALDMVLDSIAAALRRHPRDDHRHRIVHAQVLAPDLIARLRDMNMVVDIQPKFVTGELGWAGNRLGEVREPYAYCWRTLIESGVMCAGGSDCPVEPLEPLWGIYAAVTRSGMAGEMPEGWLPAQRIDPLRAIQLFTLDAAYGAFEEHIKGSLEPGKLTDFVVLDHAVDKVAPHDIKDLTVEMTVVGGRVVHSI